MNVKANLAVKILDVKIDFFPLTCATSEFENNKTPKKQFTVLIMLH